MFDAIKKLGRKLAKKTVEIIDSYKDEPQVRILDFGTPIAITKDGHYVYIVPVISNDVVHVPPMVIVDGVFRETEEGYSRWEEDGLPPPMQ